MIWNPIFCFFTLSVFCTIATSTLQASDEEKIETASEKSSSPSLSLEACRAQYLQQIEKSSATPETYYQYGLMLKDGLGGAQDLEGACKVFRLAGEKDVEAAGEAYVEALFSLDQRDEAIAWLRDVGETFGYLWAERLYFDKPTAEEWDFHERVAYFERLDWDRYASLQGGGVAGAIAAANAEAEKIEAEAAEAAERAEAEAKEAA